MFVLNGRSHQLFRRLMADFIAVGKNNKTKQWQKFKSIFFCGFSETPAFLSQKGKL